MIEKRKELFTNGNAGIVLKEAVTLRLWQLTNSIVSKLGEHLESADISFFISGGGGGVYDWQLLQDLILEHPSKFGSEQVAQLQSMRNAKGVLKLLKEKRPDLFPRSWWMGRRPAAN
ncbi:MAG: hypothetical protein Q8P84_06985 [Deltaproteobacteria bacterium]|nr:hypothetical protein [Deltaproteobacteria bacterium]